MRPWTASSRPTSDLGLTRNFYRPRVGEMKRPGPAASVAWPGPTAGRPQIQDLAEVATGTKPDFNGSSSRKSRNYAALVWQPAPTLAPATLPSSCVTGRAPRPQRLLRNTLPTDGLKPLARKCLQCYTDNPNGANTSRSAVSPVGASRRGRFMSPGSQCRGTCSRNSGHPIENSHSETQPDATKAMGSS